MAAKRILFLLLVLVLSTTPAPAVVVELEGPLLPPQLAERVETSPLRTHFLAPTRVVWKSDAGVKNADNLLAKKPGQAVLSEPQPPCVLTPQDGKSAGVLLDFGVEVAGSVEIFTPMAGDKAANPVRVRFGESVSEAMSDLNERGGGNDHAVRDQVVGLPWLGKKTVGPSGFRFVRIDTADPKRPVHLSQVRAVVQLREAPWVGSFRCDDERLNRIWQTGAYTVHLNMQDYLWDGVKRDRLVWIGDMHPETSTICAVFGRNEVVERSLDLTRDVTPVTEWMNGISSYSMWWVLIHEQWWLHHGDRAYLESQRAYLQPLLKKLAALVGEDGREKIDGMRFLDWPSSPNKEGVTAGLQGLLVMTLDAGARLMRVLGDEGTVKICKAAADRGRKVAPDAKGSKSGAALQSLAGLREAGEVAKLLKQDGAKGVSTFYGYYVLQALAKAGETDAALDIIRSYWGAMLDFGATTFWEDFDLAWTKDAARIDELVPVGKKDLHGDFGAYCYLGFRHSLCHGWASGPTAWLSEHVLGVTPIEPGCAKVRIAPQLGSLKWAEGKYPTPRGAIKIRHERQADGTVKSTIQAPPGVEVVK
jgi:hypothetical protein